MPSGPCAFFVTNPYNMSTESPGPQQSRLDILSQLGTQKGVIFVLLMYILCIPMDTQGAGASDGGPGGASVHNNRD